jgi:hypothetical protein
MRYLVLAHFKDGLSDYTIANALKIWRTSINNWVAHF